MLVHPRVTPSSMSPVPILYNWVERDNVRSSFLSEETTRWQGLDLESPTFRSEVQHANHYTTAPPQHCKKSGVKQICNPHRNERNVQCPLEEKDKLFREKKPLCCADSRTGTWKALHEDFQASYRVKSRVFEPLSPCFGFVC